MAQFILSAFADEASKDLDRQIGALLRNRIACLEPRSVDGAVLDKTDDEVREIRRKLDAAGLGVSAFGSPIGKYSIEEPFAPHLASFRRAMEICHLLGTNRMRVFSFHVPQDALTQHRDEVLRRMTVFAEEAKKEGILLCHENEKKIYGQNPAEVRDLLANVPGLRGVFDASNYLQCHDDPIEGYEATVPALEYLHIKDAEPQGKYMVPVGKGAGRYDEILRRVDEVTDRTVTLTLEPHLFQFQHFKNIDEDILKTGLYFETALDAFDCAAAALRSLLQSLGFHEEEKVWKK